MQINFNNVFKSGTITKDDFKKSGEKIPEFLKKIEARNQGFYQIFEDDHFMSEVERIKAFATSVEGKYDDIVVCGIGGSALGTITLRDSLMPLFAKPKVRLHVMENIDPDPLTEIVETLDFTRTLFVIISKSGGTPEPIAEYFYFRNLVNEKKLEAKNHFVFVTGPQGFLHKEAVNNDFQTFSVPENIGGRYSVLTAVGLLPACLIGINIDELLSGGREISNLFLNNNFDQNLPFQIASTQFLSKKPQNVLMPYATKLRTFTAWFSQLLAESTGKDGKGITPIPALGVTDQHSQFQLFSDGQTDKLIIFIEVNKFPRNPKIPVLVSHEKTDFLKGVDFTKLLHAEMAGSAQALTEKKKPNFTISIDEISAKNLGALFVLFEGATAFLGEFMEINAFDQPGVERSKVLTRANLR